MPAQASLRFAKMKVVPLAGLLALLVVAASIAFYALHSARGSAAVSTFLADPLAVFSDRSPGERSHFALLQTKRPYRPRDHEVEVSSNVPSERVLAKVRTRSAAVPKDNIAPPNSPMMVSNIPLLPLQREPSQPGFDLNLPPPLNDGGGSEPIIEGNGTGGGIGGGGTGGGAPPVAPAVPEPATWTMMIVGFFSIGAALRLRMSVGANNLIKAQKFWRVD